MPSGELAQCHVMQELMVHAIGNNGCEQDAR